MGKFLASPLHVPQLSAHPLFVLPDPRDEEDAIAYTLRCAAQLISPPKLDGEDEDTACEVVAQAVRELEQAIRTKWHAYQCRRLVP